MHAHEHVRSIHVNIDIYLQVYIHTQDSRLPCAHAAVSGQGWLTGRVLPCMYAPAQQGSLAAVATTTTAADGSIIVQLVPPLGLTLEDDSDYVRIKGIKEGGNAEATGKFMVGMAIMSINGEACLGKTKKEVGALVKAAAGTLAVGVKSREAEKARSKTPAPEGTYTAAEYRAMGKLSLVKILRTRDVGYKGKSKDEMAELAISTDPNLDAAAPAPPKAEEPKVEPKADAEASKLSKTKSSKKTKAKKLKVGDRVNVEEYDGIGTIRFVGDHHETGKPRIGVEFDEPVAKGNGTFKVWHSGYLLPPNESLVSLFTLWS